MMATGVEWHEFNLRLSAREQQLSQRRCGRQAGVRSVQFVLPFADRNLFR